MRSPLGPTLVNASLCFHEQIWLNECPDKLKPVYYRRYVDGIFVLLRSPDHLEKFKNYLNSKHRNIRFTCEKEHSNSMPFLDVLITRTSNGFKTSVYHKPIFSGVYLNFNSFISEEYKVGLIFLDKLSLDLRTRLRISLRSNVVYKFLCGRCNATYYGKTCRHLSVRVGEHLCVSPLTGKRSKSKTSTAVKDHMLFCDHIVSIDDFKTLTTSDSDFHVKVKDSLLISRDEPILNKNKTSLPRYLFD